MKKIIGYIIILFTVIQIQSCYTVIQHTTVSNSNNETLQRNTKDNSNTESVIEGTVGYIHGGGTMEINYSPGFVLNNYRWISNGLGNSESVLYLQGFADSSYLNKRVRLIGVYYIPGKSQNPAPDYSSRLYFKINKIEIIY
jgi:hypothetical protein